jgi:putative methionine-R-sulfoxide reductase with GAF domain
MNDKDFGSQIEESFSDIVPKPETEKKDESLLEKAIAGSTEAEIAEAVGERQEVSSTSTLAWEATLREQRLRILNILLGSVTVIGGVAVGALLIGLAQRPGRLVAYIPYFIAYVVLMSVTLARRLDFTLRATVLVMLAYVVGISSLLRNGPLGTGGLYLLIAPLLFSILVKQRAGAVATAVSVTLYVAFAIARYQGWFQPAAVYDLTQLYFVLNLSGTFAMIAVGAMFIQWMFNYSLISTLREVEEKHTEAIGSRAFLEEQANELATANALLRKLTLQLQTAIQVSRATTSMLDPDELLRQVVNLARERFNLYYVGLFLLDEQRRFAVLRAGTGEVGQKMLAQGHRLEVGGDSMIGQCTARGEARIALDVGEEAVRFDNPLLPRTRSEMALPLRSRGQVIGAMTVQSVEEAAFDEAAIAVMQTMADQVANAIENARLLEGARRLAQRERTISQITSKLRGALNLEDILQTTVQELGQALGASEAVVRLGTEATLLSNWTGAELSDGEVKV